ncbi:MAG: DUF3341 domain-containing protein [Gemmatimonadaceae bacterium]
MSKGHSLPAQLLGEFADATLMMGAIDALRANGYRRLETFTPFDIPELDEHLDLGRSRLPVFVLACGVAGLVLSYAIQWWANVHEYPLNIGGRPINAVPAFVLATFEGAMLGAALGAFFGLFLWLRLPDYSSPLENVAAFERASADRFLILVGGIQSRVDSARAEGVMNAAGATHTVSSRYQ